MRGGLTRRTILASALLAVVVGGAFAVLVGAVDEQRSSAVLATRSQETIVAANVLERLVLDLETGPRGYLVSGRELFLQPWSAARDAYRAASRRLVTFAGDDSGQTARAREIASALESYVEDYSVPLVRAARRGAAAARSPASLAAGKRRVDALRMRFDDFVAEERALFTTRQDSADVDARRAVVVATAGLAGSIFLIVLFGAYVTRAIALPVRRAAFMAGRLAGGDLATRVPETGTGEVRTLERAFNTMASSLEASRDELRMIGEEQAALRRVATLVARAVPPDDLFDAVAAEVHRLLGADVTRLVRYEDDGTASVLGGRGGLGTLPSPGTRFRLEGENVTSKVLRTRRAARMENYDHAPGTVSASVRASGLRCAVGTPIVVGDRLWGAIVAAWKEASPSPDTEERTTQFTDLVATAIANAQSRAELSASRARIVATADETRRRIERDLHDGAQQRLVHTVITLKLARRALGDAGGPAAELVEEALEHAERATAELRDLAHGILPAALSRGGLSAGIETLVSRVRLPVSVDVTEERLPPALEAAAYFVVAEALLNTVKHAQATRAHVTASLEDGVLRVEVRDDGLGGARADAGSGLLGLRDRVAAMNGRLRVESPLGGGTVVDVTLPVRDAPHASVGVATQPEERPQGR